MTAKQLRKEYHVNKKEYKTFKKWGQANGFKTSEVLEFNRLAGQAGMSFNEYMRDRYYNQQNDRLNQIEMDYNSVEAVKQRQYNSAEAQVARNFNHREAQIARDWEERMSNTSHQREVQDLKMAGLNPVLSANGGAMSYTTSSANATPATSSSASSDVDSSLTALASNASTLYGWKEAKLANKTNLQIARWNKQVGMAQAQASMANAGAMVSAAALSAGASKYAADKQYKGTIISRISTLTPYQASLFNNYLNGTLTESELRKKLGTKTWNKIFGKK